MTARKYDTNNWFEIRNNPISKVGVFDYSGRQIGAPDSNKIYKVYRPAEELFSQECIDSFKLLPIVDDHTMLGDANEGYTPVEHKGAHGVIGEDIKPSGNLLTANLKIFSDKMKKLIGDGKRELSCGYRCLYKFTSGVYNGESYDAIQYNIRGNHLALVGEGRMGPDVAVMDGIDTFIFTIDSKEIVMAEDNKEQTVTLDAITKLITDAVTEVTKTFDKKLEDIKVKPVEDESEEEKAERIKKEATDKEETRDNRPPKFDDSNVPDQLKFKQKTLDSITKLESDVKEIKETSDKAFISRLAARDKLAETLSYHIGAFDAKDKTLDEVAAYGLDKLGLKCDKGLEHATLNGYLYNRPVVTKSRVTEDGKKEESSEITNYITGKKE